jgi:hypothetical protein
MRINENLHHKNYALIEILKNYISINNIIMWIISGYNFSSIYDPFIHDWDQKIIIYLLNWYCIFT